MPDEVAALNGRDPARVGVEPGFHELEWTTGLARERLEVGDVDAGQVAYGRAHGVPMGQELVDAMAGDEARGARDEDGRLGHDRHRLGFGAIIAITLPERARCRHTPAAPGSGEPGSVRATLDAQPPGRVNRAPWTSRSPSEPFCAPAERSCVPRTSASQTSAGDACGPAPRRAGDARRRQRRLLRPLGAGPRP